ncbi:Spermidine synthase [Minicystis rosea]|nr:Spermidine synthase [Minicystis rosea]
MAVREIGATFFSTELLLLLVTMVTLAGPSIGYAIAHRIPDRVLAIWGCLSVALLLTLPFGVRALVGAMGARGHGGIAVGLTVLACGALVSGFHAVFLPRAARSPVSLSTLYAAELGGALAALALIALAPSYRVTLALAAVTAVLVLHLGLARPLLSLAFAAAAVATMVAYPRLDDAAARLYYAGWHGRRAPQIIESEYSPYQRIDVVDDERGRRALYLDGIWFFRSHAFDGHNRFLADLPGALHPGRGPALVIGSGSFSSAAYLHHLGYSVTVVELDEAVARIGFLRFGEVHGLAPGEVKVWIGDARRFLSETTSTFDIIAVDVPAPYHVRTALLHTPTFYRLAASHLRPSGVVALSLCGSADGPVGKAIAAAAAEVFPQVIAVESSTSGLAHLYGGAPLPFSAADVSAALAARDPAGGRVHDDAAVRASIHGVAPLTEARLAPVLVLARSAMEDVLRGD